jgi:hypothetical protein
VRATILDKSIGCPAIIGTGKIWTGNGDHRKQYAFSCQEAIPYPTARELFPGNGGIISLARELGRLSQCIHSTETIGFGNRIQGTAKTFSLKSWKEAITLLVKILNVEELFRKFDSHE